jgi:hypothetical protein
MARALIVPDHMQEKSGAPDAPNPLGMRRIALILGTLAIALAVIVATGVFRPASNAAAPSTVPSPVQSSPAPAGALVLGAQAGELAVGLAAARAQGSLDLIATVLGQDGTPIDGLGVSFATGSGVSVEAERCGSGCYTASVPENGRAAITVGIQGRPGATFEIPASWKPADAIVRRLTRTYRDLSSVAYEERLESSPGNAIETAWRVAAPDRLAYAIAGGAAGVVIGDRRWDRSPGEPWIESPQEPLRLPVPPWGGRFTNASLLGSSRVDGRPVSIVSFVSDLGIPAWFTVTFDKASSRPVEVKMTTAAHFMTQRYTAFDTKPSISPPG